MKCNLCKKEKNSLKNTKKHGRVCSKCFREYLAITKLCYICNRFRKLKLSNPQICETCYCALKERKYKKQDKTYYTQPKEQCSFCGEIKELKKKNPRTCGRCYKSQREKIGIVSSPSVKKLCTICGQYGVFYKKGICGKCYKPPKKECIKCGKITKIISKGLCKKCYEPPKKECSMCKNIRPVSRYINKNTPLCKNCVNATVPKYKIIRRLRSRVRSAFKTYIETKKYKKTDEYGINYKAIIKHLGSCPGNIEEYHIDHIIPISAFDFSNPEHIKAAFAPENHQWLKIEENLKKGNKYSKLQFLSYMDSFCK